MTPLMREMDQQRSRGLNVCVCALIEGQKNVLFFFLRGQQLFRASIGLNPLIL